MKSRAYYCFLSIFLYTILTGVLRKWFISSETVGNIILFGQMLLPFIFIASPDDDSGKPQLKFILYVYAIILAFLSANPLNKTIYHGIIGFVLHFGFWYAVFYYLQHRKTIALEKMMKLFIIFSSAEIILAMVQYSLPTGHILNKYASSQADFVSVVGDAVRVSGTFSYISGFGGFMLFYGLMIWAMFRLEYNGVVLTAMLTGGGIAALMNGSRAIVFIYLASVLFGMMSARKIETSINLAFKIIISFLAGTMILFSLPFSGDVQQRVNHVVDNFAGRLNENKNIGEQSSRIYEPLQLINVSDLHPLTGVGLGATYQGANALWGTSEYIKDYKFQDQEPQRILTEGGLLLMFTRIGLFIVLMNNILTNKFFMSIYLLLIFGYVPIISNVYDGIFLFLGLCLLDRVYYITGDDKLTPA